MRPSQLIDPADRLRLEAAVFEAERASTGEIVLVVVGACDDPVRTGWSIGLLLAALVFLALALFAPPEPLSILLAAQAGALLLGHGLARFGLVRRLVVSEARAQTRVANRARKAFAEQGLTRTAGRTGILIFVSLLERRVVVLADEGIHRLLAGEESWKEVVDLAVEGLRRGVAVEGLLGAVRRCGDLLRAHVPGPPRNPDELPNAVVVVD